jgi:serine/threonine-protein phosphatase PGAM5
MRQIVVCLVLGPRSCAPAGFVLRLMFCLMGPFLFPALAGAVLPTYDQPVRTLWLIRHGEYDHADSSPDEGGLVALGRQQTRLLAARLDGYPVVFTSLQASTMTRARQTAELLAEAFPELTLTLHDDLRECTPPTTRQDIMQELKPGEAKACTATLEAAWARLFVPATGDHNEHDLVVCHGNVIRWFMARIVGNDPVNWLEASIANCSITVVQVRADGTTKLISFADSGHIPWGMTTYPGVEAEQ